MFLIVLLLFNGAIFLAAMFTRGSEWSETWVNMYHDDLRDSNRSLVWTNLGKLLCIGGLEVPCVFNRYIPLQRRLIYGRDDNSRYSEVGDLG